MNQSFNPALVEGFLLGAGLFTAMGPKDAFVIRNGLARQPQMLIVAICILADAILIGVGVAGVGQWISTSRMLEVLAMLGGGAYLFWFGATRLWAAATNTSMPSDEPLNQESRRKVLLSAVMVSFFNPYAWLDTVVIIGTISGTKDFGAQSYFASGAAFASFTWFSSLAILTHYSRNLFSRPWAWRTLDLLIGVVMLTLAAKLIVDVFQV